MRHTKTGADDQMKSQRFLALLTSPSPNFVVEQVKRGRKSTFTHARSTRVHGVHVGVVMHDVRVSLERDRESADEDEDNQPSS